MHLLGQRLLGIVILLLLAALVAVKRRATGSVLDRPEGGFVVQLVNVFNLFFLLVVNPLAAILLLARRLDTVDPTHVTIGAAWLLTLLEIIGLLKYLGGFLLMAWALAQLGKNYQLGGSVPRTDDRMVTAGPYRLVRHPMYTAALGISLGLALLTQSLAFLGVFCGYIVLLVLLVPLEEKSLLRAYGDKYAEYSRKTKKIVPFLY